MPPKVSVVVQLCGLENRIHFHKSYRKFIVEDQPTGSWILQTILSNVNNHSWLLAIVLSLDDVYSRECSACRVDCGNGEGLVVVFGHDTQIPNNAWPTVTVTAGITDSKGQFGIVNARESIYDHFFALMANGHRSSECCVELHVAETNHTPNLFHQRCVPKHAVRFIGTETSWRDCNIQVIRDNQQEEERTKQREDKTAELPLDQPPLPTIQAANASVPQATKMKTKMFPVASKTNVTTEISTVSNSTTPTLVTPNLVEGFYAPFCSKLASEYQRGMCSQVNAGLIQFKDEEFRMAKCERKRELKTLRMKEREKNLEEASSNAEGYSTPSPKHAKTKTDDEPEDPRQTNKRGPCILASMRSKYPDECRIS